MIELYFILVVLGVNWLLIFVGQQFNVLNIVMQLIGAMLIAPIISIHFPQIDINHIANGDIVKKVYEVCFVMLITYILHDNIDGNYQKKDLQLVIPSFFIPFISGVICSIIWFEKFHLQQAIVFGIIFSITAVPVLYMYLKCMNYNTENTKFFIQSAIMIDIISWLAYSLVSEFHYSILALLFISFLASYITSKFKPKFSGIILILTLLITSYFKDNLLLVGVVYIITSSYLKIPINLYFSEVTINKFNSYLFIPVILFVGLLKIKWNEIEVVFNYKLLVLLILPLISKILGNYIGLTWLKKDDKLNSSILLNTRGLTEIVFLNLVFGMKIIDSYTYVIFLIMSLICTLLPAFFCKKQI